MKNSDIIYEIVMHVINWLLFGFIGFIAFFSVVNISPTPSPYGLIVGYIITMLIIWGINYWYQSFRRRKWSVLVGGTILYIIIAVFLLGVVMPLLVEIFYPY